jgi:cytochrome b6-f complex iron-sulfur subunit
MKKLWLGLGVVAAAEFVFVGVAFLRPGKKQVRQAVSDGVVTAGRVDDFEPGSVTAFRKGQFYLARLEDGGFLALSRKCTHLGCTVPWNKEEGMFTCPCHASTFDITGTVLSPPAPRALDTFPVIIEGPTVKVDTSKRLERRRFSPEQVEYQSNI